MAVVKRAKELGVKNILITHALTNIPGLSMAQAQECGWIPADATERAECRSASSSAVENGMRASPSSRLWFNLNANMAGA